MPIFTLPDQPLPLPGKGRGTPGSVGGASAGSTGQAATDNSAFTGTGQATPVPVARGRVKISATLIEKLPLTLVQIPAYQGSHQYRIGDLIASNGNAYRCIVEGISVNAPSGGGVSPSSLTLFTFSETVGRGYIRVSLGNVYIVLVGGVCGLTGPGGTGSNILDSGGTVVWAYLGPYPFSGVVVDAHLSGSTIVVDMVWQYLQALPYSTFYQQFVLLLCQGQVSKAISIWIDKAQYSVTDAAGLSLPGGLQLLTGPDGGGQVLPGGGLYDSTGYQHSAVLVPISTAGISTGTQIETPDVAAEIDAVTFDSLAIDMNAADHVIDQITHSIRGFGWPSSKLHTSIGSSDPASLRTWSDAKGVRFSHVNDSQRAGVDLLSDYANGCNVVFFMSQGKLKAVPLDDTATTTPALGSVNYVPNVTARYNITPADVQNGQPVSFTPTLSSDLCNSVPVEYTDRSEGYVTERQVNPVLSDLRKRGIVMGSTITLPFIFPDGTWPAQLSRIAANASLYCSKQYTVIVGPRFIALEQADIVTIPVGESITSFSQVPVRILQVDKGSDFWRTLTCIDCPAGIAAPAAFTPQKGDGLRQNGFNTVGSIPQAPQQAALTNEAPDNLWPNGNSEANPPSYIQVLNDGSLPEWDYRVNVGTGAAFTGSISTTVLTAGTPTSGSIGIGDQITGTGVSAGTYVQAQLTGPTGGAGTYTVSLSQTATSTSMTAAGAFSGEWVRQITTAGTVHLSVTVPCSPGEAFTFIAQGRYVSGNGLAELQLGPTTVGNVNSNGLSTPGAWTSLIPIGGTGSTTFTVPAGATSITASIFVGSTGGTFVAQFDSIILRRATQPVHITPGGNLQGLTTDATGATVWSGDTSWTAPTLSSIANAGAGNQAVGFIVNPTGGVSLRGVGASLSGTSAGTTVFTLPSGYRPTATEVFSVECGAGLARVDVFSTGAVVVQTTLSAFEFISFSGISFSTN